MIMIIPKAVTSVETIPTGRFLSNSPESSTTHIGILTSVSLKYSKELLIPNVISEIEEVNKKLWLLHRNEREQKRTDYCNSISLSNDLHVILISY